MPAIKGWISRFNARGSYILLRHLPKEPAQREGRVQDWHGYWHTVTINYERYQRQIIPAPLTELQIIENLQNAKIARSPLLVNNVANQANIKHIINLFLELFGECELLQENLLPALNVPITRLNWDILPPCNYPWATLQPRIQTVLNNLPVARRGIIQERFEYLSSFTPNFVATGRAGFKGYYIFGFQGKEFFILESMFEGNATYVLGQDWNQIAQLSKAEILNNNLHLHRFLHNITWQAQINNIM
ncbi:hypothetical protein HK413_03435 [Mucilaginibacter sp. S1162]|uniref:Uncharacterized protein n=1 Tax=Mucilaginibacter humi TaxID=2732510 RepID=A0ABX1W577_9SPHI|nr:hypothetical protein [Mucilaginibacter humi]NNU33450.1 hypothetical protein [Mucilaginibacter humi]